jgi:hypothetical protein
MKPNFPRIVLATLCAIAPLSSAVASDPPALFQETFSYSLSNYWCENHLDVADMDGDGRKDIVLMATALANTNGPPWSYLSRALLLRAQPDGTFADSVITNYPGRYGYGAFAAELNNDGATDLILREQGATHVLLNDGRGAFRQVWTGTPGYYNLVVVDVNRDGFLDFVSGTQTGSGGLIEVFTNNGAGTRFSSTWRSRLYGSGYDSIQTVLNVNLNGDGLPDIAAREIYGGRLITLFGTNSSPPLVEHSETLLGNRTFGLAAGRLNGDALDDLAVGVGWGHVRVLVNRGDGSMSNHWQSPNLEQAPFNLALADFDQDGFDDIFVGTFGDGALRIYRNTPGAGFEEWWQGRVPGAGYTGTVADLNGDGQPDLIVGEKNGIRVLVNRTGHPKITSLRITDAGATLTWDSLPARRYRVQFRNGSQDSTWTELDGEVTADSTTATKVDGAAGSEPQRLYRIVQLP